MRLCDLGGRGRPKLHWVDNVTKWSGRSVDELRKAAIESEQVMAVSLVMPCYKLRMRQPRTQVYAELWSVEADRSTALDSSSGVVRMWVQIPAWPVTALVSLSKILNHNCFVLRMGRKAVGPVCCVMHVKEPRTLIVKRERACPGVSGFAPWATSRVDMCALQILSIINKPHQNHGNHNEINYLQRPRTCVCVRTDRTPSLQLGWSGSGLYTSQSGPLQSWPMAAANWREVRRDGEPRGWSPVPTGPGCSPWRLYSSTGKTKTGITRGGGRFYKNKTDKITHSLGYQSLWVLY